MTAIQRFALHGTIMNPHSSGPYVRHEDHLAAMQGRCLAQIEEPAAAPGLTDGQLDDESYRVNDEPGFSDAFRAGARFAERVHGVTASAARAVTGKADWWRGRADEIEVQVARSGSQEAMRCYTDMRTLLQAAAPALEAPSHQCCNLWFLSLPEGRQAVLRENQWMLADAAYQAGRESRSALEAPAALLTKPALVGSCRFGVGVPERYVIDAAQRHHEQEGQREAMTAEQFADEERKRRTLWELIHGPLAAAPQAPAAPSEPVYQISQPYHTDPKNTWRDASEAAYDVSVPARRRVLFTGPAAPAAPAVDAKAHDWRENASYGGEICAECGAAKGSRRGNAPCAWPPEPLDVCTDPYNCARCKTHPAHRGDMHHAGISRIGGSA